MRGELVGKAGSSMTALLHGRTPIGHDTSIVKRVYEHDAAYQQLAAAEAAYWSQPPPYSLESLEGVFDDGPVEQYVNRRFTGDPKRGWWETLPQYGSFRRGLVLGTSSMTIEAGILRTNPDVHLTFVDISEGALARRREHFGAQFSGRFDTGRADLNFIELPPAAYDLVVSSASLHHVTNLEYLADQIGRALRPGGYFFMQDYVGEQRFQFNEAKRRLFETFYLDYLRRLEPQRQTGLIWRDASDLSPFCGVRSNEVLPVLGDRLHPVSVRTANALLIPLGRAQTTDTPPPIRKTLPKLVRHFGYRFEDYQRQLRGLRPRMRPLMPKSFFDEIFALDALLCDAGTLLPGIAFAVYTPR